MEMRTIEIEVFEYGSYPDNVKMIMFYLLSSHLILNILEYLMYKELS